MKLTVTCVLNGLHEQSKFQRGRAIEAANSGRVGEAIELLQHVRDLDAIYEQISHKISNSSRSNAIIDAESFVSLVRQHVSGAHFFVYDNDGGMTDHETADEARACAENVLQEIREGWNDTGEWGEAPSLCWGIIFGKAKEVHKDTGDNVSPNTPYNKWVEYELAGVLPYNTEM